MMQEADFLTIKQVSHMTGIPSHTLRFWENEFGNILKPLRTSGGQRRYSEKEISVISEIKKLKEAGRTLDDIKRKLNGHDDKMAFIKNTRGVEQLADKVAEIVRNEIHNYFKS